MASLRFPMRFVWLLGGAIIGCHSVEAPSVPTKQPATLYPGIPAPLPIVQPVRVATHKEAGTAIPSPVANVIDLGVALRLAGVGNPTINLARELVREALAAQLAARSLLLPTLNVGGNYRLHTGPLLASGGFILSPNLQSLYLGAGAGVVGGGAPPTPGVQLFVNLGDAAYEPLVAQQRVQVRRGESQAVQNSILLEVATAYLELVGAEARLEILHRGETDLGELVRLTVAQAKIGQGRLADANRAEAHLELLRSEIRRGEEELAVASARLCGLLSLDPSVGLRSPGGSVLPFRLLSENAAMEELVAEALRSRPEVFARSSAIAEAETRVRQERVRPWLPTVYAGYSYGGFGGGSNLVSTDFSSLKSRNDFDVTAVWTFQSLGLGNAARVRTVKATTGAAIANYDRIVNQIEREVAEAVAAARAAAKQMATSESALGTAEEGFSLEMSRAKQAGLVRPIEVLDSFRQLLDTRQELLRAVIAFDIAQFRLFVAVGRTPGEEANP